MRQGEEKLRTGDNWLAGDEWEAQWDSFERSAFRLETLPEYRVESERGRMELFLSGAPKPPGYGAGWHERLREYRADAKSVQRVRIVRQPLTDYQRRQFAWAYPGNSEAGEEIRVLDLSTTTDPGLPSYDFWMFDDQIVIHMHYADDGTQIGRERLTGDPSEYVRYKQLAIENSVPLGEYSAG